MVGIVIDSDRGGGFDVGIVIDNDRGGGHLVLALLLTVTGVVALMLAFLLGVTGVVANCGWRVQLCHQLILQSCLIFRHIHKIVKSDCQLCHVFLSACQFVCPENSSLIKT